MVSWSDVKQWNGSALAEAIGPLNREYNELINAGEDLGKIQSPDGWSGQAAQAAGSRCGELVEALGEWTGEIAAARTAFTATSDAIGGVKNGVTEAEEVAKANNFSIADDGSIADHGVPADTPKDQREAVAEERARVKTELQERVKNVLRSADDVDNDFCKVLDKILGDTVDADSDATSLAAAGKAGAKVGSLTIPTPPPMNDATVAQNAAWWATLSDAQRKRFIQDFPGQVGNRDGIPASDRSAANVLRIDDERTRLQNRIKQLRAERREHGGPGGVGEQMTIDRKIARAEEKLDSLDEVEDIVTDRHGKVVDGKQLMLLDTSGERAKAAVANGDVDTADHVAVFTPGMNSRVDTNLVDYVQDTEALQDHAQGELARENRRGESVATVTWLGYEPPQTNPDGIFEAVVTGDSAEEGAPKLAQFYNGIDASRADNPHMTALGHSWGSLTQGYALRDHETGVDEAGFFGSPGTGTDSGEELNVPAGHTYAWEARDDSIANIPDVVERYGKDVIEQEGIHHMSTEEYEPTPGQRTEASTGHSEYMKSERGQGQGSEVYQTSEYAMARIMIGSPDFTPVPEP